MLNSDERNEGMLTRNHELERQLYRANAEVARLRELLARCARALESVPDPSLTEIALVKEAKRG